MNGKMMKLETIPEMRARHKREAIDQIELFARLRITQAERHKMEVLDRVERLAQSRITQTEAAKILDVSRACINNIIQRNRIFWPVIRQGRKAKEQT